MKLKQLIGILCIAALLGAGCSLKKDAANSNNGEASVNGFIDRRTAPPPEPPPNIPPPTPVQPGAATNGMIE